MSTHEPVSSTDVSRPRRHGWGDATARAAMSDIAESLRRTSGYRTCAIEVLRSDGMLEFVAIATDDEATRRELDGTGSPLAVMYPALDQGIEIGTLRFIRAEEMTREAFDNLAPYSVFPDIAPHDDPDRWHSEDMLIAQIRDEHDRLRGLVYFDDPRDGRRPSTKQVTSLEQSVRPTLHLALVAVEREEFAQRIRLTSAVRAVMGSTSTQLDLSELFSMVRSRFPAPFRAEGVWIGTLDAFDFDLIRPPDDTDMVDTGPEVRSVTKRALIAAWQRQEVLIIEPDRVWGDDQLDQRFRAELTGHVVARRLSEIVLVPVGVGPDTLGMLAIGRNADSARWTDDESVAAIDVAHDLGRAILNAQANERERAAVAELRQVGDYRRTLIDTVARELQNPLALVAGHLELLDALELPEEARRSLVPMVRNTARLTALAQDLALVSRLADTSGTLSTATLDLGELAAEAIEVVMPQAEHRGVAIELTVVGPCLVLGHPLELSRCIGGLLDNAVKFSHLDGRVEVELTGEDDNVILVVRDHGIGVSSLDQDLVFGEFFRSSDPAAMSRSGYGLGLTIARQVAIRHGGTISVTSTRGAGATFRLSLPRADPLMLTTTW